MFTGIIKAVAVVKQLEHSGKTSVNLEVSNPFPVDDLELGESIATNGVCLTVVQMTPQTIRFNVAPETLERTALGQLKLHSKVNLERSLRIGDRMSGHWVQGHVDGVAKIVQVRRAVEDGANLDYFDWVIQLQDPKMLRYCVQKGSICVDGISLTIHKIQDETRQLSFQIIPHTWNQTNLVDLKNGDLVNIEVDLLAKYIERFQTKPELA
jgi:riboflavin synthase